MYALGLGCDFLWLSPLFLTMLYKHLFLASLICVVFTLPQGKFSSLILIKAIQPQCDDILICFDLHSPMTKDVCYFIYLLSIWISFLQRSYFHLSYVVVLIFLSILCSFTTANINLSNELFVSFPVFVVCTFTDIEQNL